MEKRTINLYSILEEDEKLFQDVIDGKICYTLAKSFIYGWMKEACKQTLELACENAKISGNKYGDAYVNKQSILETIKQIE
jgi:hypothetical protein